MDRVKLFIPLRVFLLVAAACFRLELRMTDGSYDPTELPSALVGKTLPDFEMPLLRRAEALRTPLDLQGNPALLNVWATWCRACRIEHDFLLSLSNAGVAVYGLNYKDERAAALQWLEELGDPYRFSLFDVDGKLGLELGVYGAPETFVLDASGTVVYRHIGVLDRKSWERRILPLLRE